MQRAVVIWDLHGQVLVWSHHAEELYGWPAGQVLGRHVAEVLLPVEDVEAMLQVGRSVEAGEPWSGDIRIHKADGALIHLYLSLMPLRDGHDGPVVGTVASAEDLAQRLRAEERAVVLTDHLLNALAGGDLGTARWDQETDTLVWDERQAAIYGYSWEDRPRTNADWIRCVHPDDREATRTLVNEQYLRGGPIDVEHRIVWPDGSVHWVESRAMVLTRLDGIARGTIGIAGDITRRKVAELELSRRAVEAETMLEEQRRQRDRLDFLASINDLALRSSDHRQFMRDVTEAAVPRLGDFCSVHFLRDAVIGTRPEIVVAHEDPAKVEWIHSMLLNQPYDPDAHFGPAAAIRTGQTQFHPDLRNALGGERDDSTDHADRVSARRRAESSGSPMSEIVEAIDATSLIVVPLKARRGVIGAIQFCTAGSGRVLGVDDLSLAETAAGRIAESLDAQWLNESLREVATVLQASLLPGGLPDIDELGIAVRYWAAGAASEVGGDFYDVFPIGWPEVSRPDGAAGVAARLDRRGGATVESRTATPPAGGRWAVVIGDVCGTGPNAAALLATARHTIRAAARHGYDHVEVMEWLNEAVLAADTDRFCTVVYGTLEPLGEGRWRFRFVVAGHPLPLLARADGTTAHVGRTGTLIGVLPTLRLSPVEIVLEPGDSLLLHTDGITDVPEPYGIDDDRLVSLVAEAAASATSADDLVDLTGEAVRRVLPIEDRDDDIAMVVLRAGSPTTGEPDDGPPGGEVVSSAARRFDLTSSSLAGARAFVADELGDPALADVVRLIVSELATNAVIHARTPFEVRLVRYRGWVRVEVTDEAEGVPQRQPHAPHAISGRGIEIVEALSVDWGVDRRPVGKTVWCVVPTDAVGKRQYLRHRFAERLV
ncbi:MAG: SpoIIE family protein phosphatase [Microthrixaceae bacterium]